MGAEKEIMKTAIVLPSYIIDEENLALYRAFIHSLKETESDDKWELVIVDNGSKLGQFEMEADADHYVRFDEPLGYAKAVNIGVVHAMDNCNDGLGCERVVVANNDIAFPEDGWLGKMHEVYDKYGGVLCAMDIPGHNDEYYANTCWYSLWMIDVPTWKALGKLDDETLNYRFHDQDYSIRAAVKGFKVGRTGHVNLRHANSATYKKMNRNEDPEERAEMIKRWGVALFSDWIRQDKA